MRRTLLGLTAWALLMAAVPHAGAQTSDRWTRVDGGPSPSRPGAAAVWTGEEMVVLSGARLVEVTDPAKVQGSSSHLDGSRFGFAVRSRRDVAAYDPTRARWRSLASMPATDSSAWSAEDVVWTGTEIVVPTSAALLVYEVATDTWRSVPYPDPRPQAGGTAVWTGSELLFWGYPYHLPASRPWAQAFTPGPDTWRAFDPGPLGFREFPGAAWTGTEMVIAGGRTTNDQRAAAYDPAASSWRELPPPPAIHFHTPRAFWTGTGLVVIEGHFGNENQPIGARYDRASDAWRTIAAPPGTARAEYALVWTGAEVLVVDGSRHLTGSIERATPVDKASAYDPTTDSWRPLPGVPGEVTCDSALVWTGEAAIVWGGNRGCRIPTRPRPGTWVLGT